MYDLNKPDVRFSSGIIRLKFLSADLNHRKILQDLLADYYHQESISRLVEKTTIVEFFQHRKGCCYKYMILVTSVHKTSKSPSAVQ